jgi:hypothetical protein
MGLRGQDMVGIFHCQPFVVVVVVQAEPQELVVQP